MTQRTQATMHIDTTTGLIDEADYIASPNADDRPSGTTIDLIVIHSISLPPGEYGGHYIEQLFCNELPADAHPYFADIHHLRVSAHVLILRDGTLQQFVPFHKRAWHAGESCFQEREQCNDYSIGIELEGTYTGSFEATQYEKLAQLVNSLEQSYPAITRQRLVGHSDIAPGRKTDPGSGFDWDVFKQRLDA